LDISGSWDNAPKFGKKSSCGICKEKNGHIGARSDLLAHPKMAIYNNVTGAIKSRSSGLKTAHIEAPLVSKVTKENNMLL
jgi:hypothetical protein